MPKSQSIDVQMLSTEIGDTISIFVRAADGLPIDFQELESIVMAYFKALRTNTRTDKDMH